MPTPSRCASRPVRRRARRPRCGSTPRATSRCRTS
jgi:hypothetical protein